MRLTKPEKKALLDLLEWATAYHMEEIEQWIDPREGPFILDQPNPFTECTEYTQ
jgi:hypothetical protein